MALFPSGDNEYTVETRDAPPSQLLVKIESFSLLWKYGFQQYESMEFAAGDCKWRLIIYPNKEDISADLAIAGTNSLPKDWEVVFPYSSAVEAWTGKVRRFHAMKSTWGFSKFISKKNFTDPSNGFLVDDKCVFGAEIFVCKRQRVIECVSLLKETNAYVRYWKISKFSKLKEIWHSEEFTAGGHKWNIQLYRNGNGSERGRNVSFFLWFVGSNREKVKVNFCLRIKNQLHGGHHTRTASHVFTSSEPSWGWHAFMPISDMRDPSKGFIIKDCCLLETEITAQLSARDAR